AAIQRGRAACRGRCRLRNQARAASPRRPPRQATRRSRSAALRRLHGIVARMRVARIITRLNIGGPSIQALTLSDRLNARGIDTLLIHGSLGAGEGDMRYLAGRNTFCLRGVPALQRSVAPLQDTIALVQVYRELCTFRPSIVHTHMAKAGSIGRMAAAAYNRTAGRRAPARIVHTYHGHVLEGYFSASAARVFTAAERGLARISDAIVAISPRIERELL